MAKKGHSDPNLFGGYTHYDEHGKKTGSSQPGSGKASRTIEGFQSGDPGFAELACEGIEK